MVWEPSLGAVPTGDGVRFLVHAPGAKTIELVLEPGGAGSLPASKGQALERNADGGFHALVSQARPGDRYRYLVDGQGLFPDPASRFQPEGVHGPSEIIDPTRFAWTDDGWRGIALDDLVVYELHVGTFTPEGTLAAIIDQLPHILALGATAIELMPVADFPGGRNWGYDGVSLFAPARCYGRPEDLRQLVNAAHRRGLGLILDVVYNHFGPDGNYLGVYNPYYLSATHQTPWGKAINFDGPHAAAVRAFFIENALHWIHEYHLDGLRLDATHGIVDEGPRHFLAELCARVRASVSGREVLLIAEDHRNLAHMVRPAAEGGWGLDAVWADDFHHQVRRLLAGDREGYYRDYRGTTEELAATIRQGWLYTGQHSAHLDEPRGTDPAGIGPSQLVFCIQNHDQIGNRALGERLHHQIDLAAYRAATTLLLCLPHTPLLFMGQEWAASSPFLFFTDHDAELGKLVTEGRREEFKAFSAFSDPARRQQIPDPQAPSTFLASRLNWAELEREPHASTFKLYQALTRLRRQWSVVDGQWSVHSTPNAISVVLPLEGGTAAIVVAVLLVGAGTLQPQEIGLLPGENVRFRWEMLLASEDPPFAHDPAPPQIELIPDGPRIIFQRPGAVIFRRRSVP